MTVASRFPSSSGWFGCGRSSSIPKAAALLASHDWSRRMPPRSSVCRSPATPLSSPSRPSSAPPRNGRRRCGCMISKTDGKPLLCRPWRRRSRSFPVSASTAPFSPGASSSTGDEPRSSRQPPIRARASCAATAWCWTFSPTAPRLWSGSRRTALCAAVSSAPAKSWSWTTAI